MIGHVFVLFTQEMFKWPGVLWPWLAHKNAWGKTSDEMTKDLMFFVLLTKNGVEQMMGWPWAIWTWLCLPTKTVQ